MSHARAGSISSDAGGPRVQRDIFPLPAFKTPSPQDGKSSWVSGSSTLWEDDANAAIRSLNAIMGFNSFCRTRPSEAQDLALSEIKSAYRYFASEPCEASVGEPPPTGGWLRGLCGGSAAYSGQRSDLKPYAEENVSWPSAGAVPVNLSSAWGKADQIWLKDWQSNMLRSSDDTAALQKELNITPASRYIDPALRFNRKLYVRFVQQLAKRGMVKFKACSRKAGNLGFFLRLQERRLSQTHF